MAVEVAAIVAVVAVEVAAIVAVVAMEPCLLAGSFARAPTRTLLRLWPLRLRPLLRSGILDFLSDIDPCLGWQFLSHRFASIVVSTVVTKSLPS